MRTVITQAEILAAPEDSALEIPRDAIITPAARDVAVLRRVRLVLVDPAQDRKSVV